MEEDRRIYEYTGNIFGYLDYLEQSKKIAKIERCLPQTFLSLIFVIKTVRSVLPERR